MSKRPQTIIREFFADYAKATSAGDTSDVADAYFDTYLEAGPSAVVPYKVDADYRRQLDAKHVALKEKLGFAAAQIAIASIEEFAPGHYRVDADWSMEFDRGKKKSSTFRISYLVRMADPSPVILAYVSHEDEEKTMKRDGII